MRIDFKKYVIDTNHDLNVTIAHIADIHYSKNFKLKRLDILKEKIEEIHPNYICITGDLVDVYNITYDKSFIYFENFIKDLSNICKVIISIGNHEYIMETDEGYTYQDDVSWLKNLSDKNIIVLDNEIYSDGCISFVGYNPSVNYYSNHEVTIPHGDNFRLFKLINKLKNNYNILLIHTPLFIFQNNNYKNIKDFDRLNLVLCGHTHGGMIPSFIPGNFGIISPSKKLFPKNVRGVKLIDNTMVIISSGVTKLSRKSKLTIFTDIYGVNINKIDIKSKKNNK